MNVWLAWPDGPAEDGARPGGTAAATRARAAGLGTRAAAALLGVPAAGLRLIHQPGSAPRLAGPDGEVAEGVSVSLAHSRGAAAAVASTLGPVGVDVEPVRALGALALARRWFGEEETRWLAGLAEAERAGAFLCLWTQKEAVGKALGTGLAGGRGLRRAVLAPWPLPGPGGLRLAALPSGGEAGPPLAVAVARAGPVVFAVACRHPGAVGAPVTVLTGC